MKYFLNVDYFTPTFRMYIIYDILFFLRVSVAYDHLVVREPTQLNIYQVSKSSTIMNHLLENPVPLHRHADLFESLRLVQ